MKFRKDIDRKRHDAKDFKKRLQSKLNSSYKITNIDQDKAKKTLRNKTRAIFEFPLNYNHKRANLLNFKIAKTIKNLKPADSSVEMTKTDTFVIGSRFQSSTINFGAKMKGKNNRNILGEGDVEMGYEIIKPKIDDDLQIDAEDIFSEQFGYFRIDDEYRAINVITKL